MEEDDTPHRSAMPAFIVIFVLIFWAFASIAPMVIPGVIPMEADMKQTLIVIVVSAVSFYLGTTQQSAKKDETIASINKGNT